MTLAEWLKSGGYLPAPLRDFHDQKDVFKTLWRGTAKRLEADESARMYLGKLDWVAAQIFTIDHFLHFMAAHGWTLQRSRARGLEFCDLDALIAERKAEEVAVLRQALSAPRTTQDQRTDEQEKKGQGA